MMKKYVTPEMEIDEFQIEDVITTSGDYQDPTDDGENDF
jgi:hypothetical protein